MVEKWRHTTVQCTDVMTDGTKLAVGKPSTRLRDGQTNGAWNAIDRLFIGVKMMFSDGDV